MPFITALTLVVFTLPAQASEDECKPPETDYRRVWCSSDPRYFVAEGNDHRIQALINKQGEVVANFKGDYDAIDSWRIKDSIFAVMKDEKIGYMNTQGELIVPTAYDIMRDPDNKYDETWAEPVSDGRILVSKNGKFGIIDTANKVIMSFTDKYVTVGSISEGMAPVMSKSGKWGFIDHNGKEVIAPQYNSINNKFAIPYGFSQGLAGVKKNNKWGYITKAGTVALPFIYDEIRPFNEGLAGVLKADRWGFINNTNKTIIPFQYSDSNIDHYNIDMEYFIFNNGVAKIATVNDQPLCINKLDIKVEC